MMMTSTTSLRSTSENSVKRILLASFLLAGLTACQGKKEAPLQIPTDIAKRRDIYVTADATGKIEPINVVDIKSKAGGQIIDGPPETGTHLMPNDLIVDLDKKDVNSAFEQAKADLDAAQARLDNSKKLQGQNEILFAANVITKREKETSDLDVTSQNSSLIRSQQALELAQQRVNDATIRAPIEGTVLDKLVSKGTVIASASNSASGGTTLIRMADLSRVRARVLVSETDIGKVEKGMSTSVLVDAYPNKPFMGVVEKMEPQAVVDQNVTMFPVLVSLATEDGALMPGMNGEGSISV
jgi:HlyD family secretion protein